MFCFFVNKALGKNILDILLQQMQKVNQDFYLGGRAIVCKADR